LEALRRAREIVAGVDAFTSEALEGPLRELADELGIKAGALFGILRGAVTGQKVSPPLFETMVIMGRERTCKRIDLGVQALRSL
jgi:glutamyl-tRNA synthetase